MKGYPRMATQFLKASVRIAAILAALAGAVWLMLAGAGPAQAAGIVVTHCPTSCPKNPRNGPCGGVRPTASAR